jgi:two-component system, OmpR family, response regulator
MTKILVVDDDAHIRELVSLNLRNEGFDVVESVDGREAVEIAESDRVDLAVMDVMMPNMDGFEACEEIRKFSNMPLILLTAKGETVHKVKGFRLGVDDYVVKPFDPLELIARVQALLKRYRISMSNSIRIGKLVLDKPLFEVRSEAGRLILPLKEFELLFTLGSYPGKVFSRDELIEEIWGFDFEGNERTIDVHVNRLRERFPDNQFGFKINTVRGLGYGLEVTSS